MERRDYYRYLFLIGAIWNWLIGVIFIVASIFLTDVYTMFGTQEPLSLVWFHIFFIFVIIFGIGYFWVGQDIDKNHGIVKMGIIAKLSVVVVFFYYVLIGDFNLLAMGPPIVDLIFAILFLEFLINFNK
ncbi:MAG: hypothetical protein ACFFC7_18665 [Candidatus Hermodarchaeota archaeon]